jgi:hypothetical protein
MYFNSLCTVKPVNKRLQLIYKTYQQQFKFMLVDDIFADTYCSTVSFASEAKDTAFSSGDGY